MPFPWKRSPSSPSVDSARKAHSANSPPPGKTILKNVRAFNGHTITSPRTVLIDGEFISTPFPTTPYSAIRTIDGKTRILIPGLIDMHICVPDVAGLEDTTSYGVTTALNMACKDYTLYSYLREYPQTSSGVRLASFFSGRPQCHEATSTF